MRPRDILARHNRAALADFANSNVLLGFDYDGTLAPIASTPARAHMRATTRRLLGAVAERYPCAVISGRRLDDVTKRLAGIPIWHICGDFGHEPVPHGHQPPRHVSDWARRLTERLPPRRGLVIEEKAFSITIHYRHARDKGHALVAIERALEAFTAARIVRGRQNVTLLPHGGTNKGIALQYVQQLFH